MDKSASGSASWPGSSRTVGNAPPPPGMGLFLEGLSRFLTDSRSILVLTTTASQFNSFVLEPPFGETYSKERPFFALFSQIVSECVCSSVAKNIDLAFELAKKNFGIVVVEEEGSSV